MVKLIYELMELIKKLYPKNEYFGSYDYQPDIIQFPIKDKLTEISVQIEDICNADVRYGWDRIFDSAYYMGIHIPKTGVTDHEDTIQKLKDGVNSIYILQLFLSVLGPYYCFINWNVKYIDENRDYKLKTYDELLNKECKELKKCVINIFEKNNITLLTEDILKIEIPGMTGVTHRGKRPTILNCLFKDC